MRRTFERKFPFYMLKISFYQVSEMGDVLREHVKRQRKREGYSANFSPQPNAQVFSTSSQSNALKLIDQPTKFIFKVFVFTLKAGPDWSYC